MTKPLSGENGKPAGRGESAYDSEIDISVSSFWDDGWSIGIGDDMNGYDAEKNFPSEKLDEAAALLASEA